MGIGASRPQPPARQRSRFGRVVLVVLLALLAGMAWLFLAPPTGEAFEDGPVVVLGGGGGERLQTAIDIVGEPAPGRELVLSEGAYSEWEVRGRSCREEAVRCFDPRPANTYGEAVTVADLAAEQGWERVTVVTSDYHATRSRLYFHACLDTDVTLVAADSGYSMAARVTGAPYEVLGTLAALGNLAYC
jgi:hypothetical protein